MEPLNENLSIKRQCKLLGIPRSSYYYEPRETDDSWELDILKKILQHLESKPFYGYRKIAKALRVDGENITNKQVRRIMRKLGLKAIYPKKNLSKPGKGHKIYPYLLRNKVIAFPNQVWATDITYLKVNGSHVYLIAVLDLYSRKVLSWRLSNTMDTHFCVEVLEDAIANYGVPSIFNTDQGSQFTSEAFTKVLLDNGIRISMDGRGRALDNIYVERLWRSLKYEEIYLHHYEDVKELKIAINRYFNFYNTERFHQSLDYETPDEIYYLAFSTAVMAA